MKTFSQYYIFDFGDFISHNHQNYKKNKGLKYLKLLVTTLY